MASNRQDRLLMRQRGAGTRQIKELDFQLDLPGITRVPRSPLKPQRSGRPRKNPQPELLPRRSSRQTPQPTQLQPQSSSRRTPATTRRKKVGKASTSDLATIEDYVTLPNSLPTQSDGEGGTSKKRKLNSQENTEASRDLGNLEASKSKETRRNGIYGEQDDNSHSNGAEAPVRGRKRKKRKSIGQMSRKKPKPEPHPSNASAELSVHAGSLESTNAQLEVSAPPLDTNVVEELRNSVVPVISGSQEPNQDLIQSLGGKEDGQDSTLIPLKSQAQVKFKRKKRNSIGQAQRPRRKVSIAVEPTTPKQASKLANFGLVSVARSVKSDNSIVVAKARKARGRGRPKKILAADSIEGGQDHRIHNNGNGLVKTRAQQPPRRGRPKKQLPVISEVSQTDENDTIASEKKGARVPSPKRRGRPDRNERTSTSLPSIGNMPGEKRKRKTKATTKTKPSTARQPPPNTIPITVYRLSSAQTPDENRTDLDSLTISAPLFKNRGVNAVDVLSQICREIISKSSDSVYHATKRESNRSEKAELARRREIIEMYGEELDNRLFQLTETLDNNIALSAHVRHATKEEKSLKADLQALQRQREEISNRRTEIEAARQKAEASQTLHKLLSSIQTAVQAGRQYDLENPPPDEPGEDILGSNSLELMLRNVARDVSSAGDERMGLLERVRGFNGVLERAVAAL